MIKSFKVGDVLSESSHYKVLADNGNLNFKLKHLESGDVVYIDEKYIHNYLESADDFTNEVKVTREDKKDGTLGIRSIFERTMITLGKKRKSHLKSMRLEGVRVHVCILLLQKECLRRE